jgi:hypothetical protein
MIRSSRVVSCALLGLLGALVAQACSSSAAPAGSGGSGAFTGDSGTDLGDGSQELQPNGEGGNAGALPYNALCGVHGPADCVPDDARACSGYDPGGAGGGGPGGEPGAGAGGAEGGAAGAAGHAAGEGGHAGVGTSGAPASGASAGGAANAGEGGQGGARAGASSAGEGGQAGDEPGSSGAGGAAGEGGAHVTPEGGKSGESSAGSAGSMSGGGGMPGTGTASEYACRVVPSPGRVQAQCEPAGEGGVDAPCFSSGDCAPGLACSGDSGAGQCRRFCCAGDSACRSGTHCAERPLLGAVTRPLVPVCVPAVDCSLTEPFPCPDGVQCSCPDGEACMVVRDDGTTTCLRPGSGKAGEACPFTAGHVCSQATNQCVELCQTAASPSDCGEGRCQASAELPTGFGVCVGLSSPQSD